MTELLNNWSTISVIAVSSIAVSLITIQLMYMTKNRELSHKANVTKQMAEVEIQRARLDALTQAQNSEFKNELILRQANLIIDELRSLQRSPGSIHKIESLISVAEMLRDTITNLKEG